MLHRSVLWTAVLVLAAATATGEAMAREVVLGPADGVQATLMGGRTLEVRFTGAGDGMLRTNAFGDLASLLAFGPV
ncbi:MAG: hypothetical protein JWQ20_3217 [Conexibacter sp.]|nr:hypothetical protein [Conexibacter sp.]